VATECFNIITDSEAKGRLNGPAVCQVQIGERNKQTLKNAIRLWTDYLGNGIDGKCGNFLLIRGRRKDGRRWPVERLGVIFPLLIKLQTVHCTVLMEPATCCN